VDVEGLYAQVITALDTKDFGASIPVEVVHATPAVTRQQIERMYGRVAGFSTTTTTNANRNTNITLSTAAINGTVLQPGDTLSFNTLTGQRTPAKGYREAGAIQNGQLVEEVGGGVCQTSTTLFNALIRAGLDIVTRNPHAWPVDYINRGEDAMVNWPDKDLKMQNNTGGPIYIIGTFSNRNLTFDVYGKTLGEGIVIDLASKTTQTTQPSTPVYTQNAALAHGTEVITRKERTGYTVQTSKVVYKNGVEQSRTQIYKSEYKMYNRLVEYN
jgi:vancomycin resistance protein YoaR